MLDVLREEKKYDMTSSELLLVKSKLSKVLLGDSFNGFNSYLVRSLYFDSYTDRDLNEKAAGLSERKKIRLRIYHTDAKKAKLELKAKSGTMQRKRSLTILKEDAIELIKGNYSVLLKYTESIAMEFYVIMSSELYRPKCVIEYDRIAMRAPENNIRITIDTGVRSNEANFDFFSDKLDFYKVMPDDKGVLEVKYNRFLPSYIKLALNVSDKLETSVSKYVLARKFAGGSE
ncbi:polyphosphate polymerase domain-containing protein [Lachnobacterium bovis]|uniref:polyphosphate polymerase domain-containing protein n=1 Tax=Lachnobacterium bovis TaxID=140626 RepID=UPI0003B5E782|nr:polyphosphate polymerase domain-containing protein [Lachnobacterium bovis]